MMTANPTNNGTNGNDPGQLEDAWQECLTLPLPEAALWFSNPKLQKLVALCAALQRRSGDNPFALDCRSAARLLGANWQTVRRWFHVLCGGKILKRVPEGSPAEGKCNDYRYHGLEGGTRCFPRG
jgi:hypothetical protein